MNTENRLAQLEEEIQRLKSLLRKEKKTNNDLAAICNSMRALEEREYRMNITENAFRNIFENSLDGIMLVDHNGVVKEWNREYEKITGLTKNKALGIMLWDLIKLLPPPDGNVDAIINILKDIIDKMQPTSIMRHILHAKTGEHRILKANYFPVDMPDEIMLCCISRDVTEEVKSRELLLENERKLTAEKERLQALGDNFPGGTLFRLQIDASKLKNSNRQALKNHLQLSYVSGTWEKICNVPKEFALRNAWTLFIKIHSEDLEKNIPELFRCFSELVEFNAEIRYHYTEKEIRWLYIAFIPRVEDNLTVGDGFILDITDRKKNENELIEYHERLEYLVRERTEDLQTINRELHATTEELYSTNEELQNMNVLMRNEMNSRIAMMKKLEDNEAKLHNFINQSFEGIVIMDDKGIVIEWNKEMEKITGIAHEEAEGKDEWELLKRCLSKDDYTPEELETIHNRRMQYLKNGGKQETVTREFVFGKPEGNKAYLQLYLFPIELTETCLFGSVVHDITEQKFNDIELEQYRTNLEAMVEYQTKELTVSQENLMSLNQRQSTFIKMMQILQLEENVPAAMSRVLDVIGNYTGVNRVQIWENNLDGITYGCSYEWCGEGIEPVIHFCQNLPIEYGKPWFEMLEADKIICTSDIYTLVKPIYEMLELQRVQSIVVLPLSKYGSHFGFISYTVCEKRAWDEKDIELLSNIAQVFSNFILRRQVENAMLLSQKTMRTVLDNINANIFVTEYDTYKVLFANKSFKEEVGDDVEGKICWQSFNAGYTGPCAHCPRTILHDGKNRLAGVHWWEDYNPNTKRWYSIASTAIEWVDGQLAIMELASDITDRKLNEIELISAREKAEESDRLKSAFLANMSHEIRTPVNGIVGFLHFLSSDNLSQKRRQDYINIINNSSAQLVKLIDDIIDVAKIEAKQMKIIPVPLRLNDLMDELQLYFDTYIQTQNKVNVSLVLDDSQFIEQCLIYIDPTRLRQVIVNLINNAVKFTEKGYIRFGYSQISNDELEFVVEDTGIGMKPEQHEIIFERFRQAEVSNNRMYGGTGLGLSISRTLVQMMGGRLWVESIEGAGSSFYFTVSYLPVLPESEFMFKLTESDETTVKLESCVILAVEPEMMKFSYIEKILSASKFIARQADNLQQGLDFISKTNSVDAIIIDCIAFAGLSEDEIRQQMKPVRKDMPVIWVGNRQNLQTGALHKNSVELEAPINPENLLNVLKRCRL